LRTSSVVLVALALGAAPVAAQRRWQPEFGVQLGYSHVKPAGTSANDAITVIGVPEANYIPALLTTGSLFAIIPVANRVAVEPQFTATQVNVSLTAVRLGARLNYALSRGLYAAAGGVLNYVSPGNPGHDQLGLQAAVGYRGRLTGSLNGRVEANWISTRSGDFLPAFNAYSVFAGVSTDLSTSGAGRARRVTGQAWSPVIGLTGGYVSAHAVGGGPSFAGVFFPGSTNDLATLGIAAPAPPTLFAILPLSGRWAAEPSFELGRTSSSGGADVTAVSVGTRLDVAVHGGWYGAGGAQLVYLNPSAGSAGSILGATFAWGYRFHFAGALGSRFELNYTMSAKNSSLGSRPVNTLGLLLGLMMPLR
jgi:hypothetical protein